MEMQFENKNISCFERIVSQVHKLEETQEIRLKDEMPDIERILAVWGQPVLRGKEWNFGKIGVSCGVIVWVLYVPEGGGEVRCVEDWIPFQMKCDLPDTGKEGNIHVECIPCGMDARLISSRKMLVRVSMDISCEAMVHNELQIRIPVDTSEDLQLLKKKSEVTIPRESGEKIYTIDETLTPSGSHSKIKELIRYQLQTEIIDQKVVSDKAVFRGSCVVHLAYIADDGQMHTFDFDVPFSQYTELEDIYSENAEASFAIEVTNVELDMDDNGAIHIKAGFTAQYIIRETLELELAADAYSLSGEVVPTMDMLCIRQAPKPSLHMLKLMVKADVDCRRIADLSVCVGYPSQELGSGRGCFNVEGIVQMLYYDSDGCLQCYTGPVNDRIQLESEADQYGMVRIWQSGKLQSSVLSDGVELSAEMKICAMLARKTELDMLVDLKIVPQNKKEIGGPSLILRRSNGEDLWTIAKHTGSTVERICQVNELHGEPDPAQMLMIPILQ